MRWDGPGLASGMVWNQSLISHFVGTLLNQDAHKPGVGAHAHIHKSTLPLPSLSKHPLKNKVSFFFFNRCLLISKEKLCVGGRELFTV